jgi:small membrane protein
MTVHISQVILIILLALFILYIYRLRTILLDRIIYLLFALVGIILVIDPDFTTRAANLMGIGRGVDLITYLFILAALFYAVTLRSEVKRLERQLTAITRELAMLNPQAGQGRDIKQ